MKRLLSLIMAVLLVLSALPVWAEPMEKELPEEKLAEEQLVEEELTEEPARLAELCFREKKRVSSDERPLDPEFSPEKTDYTLVMKDYEGPSDLFAFATLAEDAPSGTVIEARWREGDQKITSRAVNGKNFPDIIRKDSLEGNTLSICLGPEGQTEETYRVNILRQATLKSLSLQDQDGTDLGLNFQRDTLEYTVENPVGEGSLRLTAKPTVSDAALTLDGEAVTAGTEITCTPQWDENGLGTLSLKVGQGDSETEYTVALRKTPPKPVRLELVTAPGKTSYRIGEVLTPPGWRSRSFWTTVPKVRLPWKI